MEIFPHSSYYGASSIFRRYAGLSSFMPFPAQVQHGWYFDPAVQTRCDVINAPAIWCWSERIRQFIADAYPAEKPVTTGAPFLYLLRLLNFKELPWDQRRGSIVFPCHSSELLRASCNFETYARDLSNLPSEYHPISVCIYYTDNRPVVTNPFIKKGFKIVSNGKDRIDPQFLFRFVRHTEKKRYAFSNQMTSALLYASALGLRTFVFGPEYTLSNLGNRDWNDVQLADYFHRWILDYTAHFLFPTADFSAQRDFVATELGSNALLDRLAMKSQLKKLMLTKEYRSHVIKRSLNRFATVRQIFLQE